MSRLQTRSEKIVGWLLVVGFVFASGAGSGASNCCCTVIDASQAANTVLVQPSCCRAPLVEEQTDPRLTCSDKVQCASETRCCDLASDLGCDSCTIAPPTTLFLEDRDSKGLFVGLNATDHFIHRVGTAATKAVVTQLPQQPAGAQDRCAQESSWQK